ncbi:MAG: transporter permease, partial [Herbinix sp.]|nr:transporter permease [Herbinix sp.]
MKKNIGNVILYLYLGIITIISLFPFYMVVIMSTYYTNDLYKGLPVLPSNYFLTNLKTVFSTNFVQVYGNSIFV